VSGKQFGLWIQVIDWFDGDTLHGVCDLSSHVYLGSCAHPIRFRCSEINAPELHDPGGVEARDFAAQLVPPGEYPCWSTGLDNYGRPLIDIILPNGELFSQAMVESGHAVKYL
jgi:endonuclease YncB( thermonuclease family)